MKWLGVVALTGLAFVGAFAQEPKAAPPADILSRRIVLAVDGMDRVVVRRNLHYRVVDGLQLPMDVYAELDQPRINQSVDDFVRGAVACGINLDLLTLARAQHGFDVLDDTARSREVIEKTVAFLRANLESRAR